MSVNSFGAKPPLRSGTLRMRFSAWTRSQGSDPLPYCLKILLENLLRCEDGANITADDVRALAAWMRVRSRRRRFSSLRRG